MTAVHSYMRWLVIAIFTFCQTLVMAQISDPTQDILPPSPTAATFSKFVEFPVNSSTGIPSVGVPLGAVSGNGVSLPISLDYHAGGVKVDEVAGIVGLGWTLSAGGMVTRTVRGIADEDALGYMFKRADIPPVPITTQADFLAMQQFAENGWDGQPDVFSFNFGQYAGKFIFENASTIRLIPKQDLRITYTTCSTCPGNTFGGSIISFTITTPDGVQYLFGTDPAVEYSTSSNYNVGGTSSCNSRSYTLPAITGWHLKSVTNPRTGDAITLNYGSHQISYDISYNENFRYDRISNPPICAALNSVSKCVTTKIDYGKHLTSIVASGGKVEFTSNSTRSDINVSSGQYRINEIRFFGRNNTLLQYFQLGQSFVQSSGTTPSTATSSTYRMYLDDVKTFGANSVQVNTQTFEYYNRTSLPPRLSYKQDHWGYYNNKPNTQLSPAPSSQTELLYVQSKFPSFSPANREPDAAVSYYGCLKKIVYPTGGSTLYEYEGNEVAVCQTVDVPTNTTAAASRTFAGSPQTQTVTFYVDHDQWVTVNYNVLMNGFRCDGASARVRTTDAGNPFTTLTWGGCAQMSSPIQLQGSVSKYMEAGNYELEVKVFQGPESGYPAPFGTQPESASITVNYVDNVPTYIANKPSGGIRLKKLTAADGSGNSPDIVKAYQYHKANNGGCANASSGVYLGRSPRYQYYDYTATTIQGTPQCVYDVCIHSNIASSSLLNMVNQAGAAVAYMETWALDGANGENGKTYWSHEIFQDGNGYAPSAYYNIFINVPTVDYAWKSGRVKEEKIFNSTGGLTSHTLNEYEFNELNDKHILKGFVARKAISPQCQINIPFVYYCDGVNDEGEDYILLFCDPFINYFDCEIYPYPCYNQPAGTQITNPSSLEPYGYEWFDHVSQSVYLKKSTKRIYNSDGSGAFVETVSDFLYDTPAFRHHFPVKTITTNSENFQFSTTSKFPTEYNTSTVTDWASIAIKNLVDNYVINQPVEVVQSIKKNGTEYVTGGQLVKFKNFSGNVTFPHQLFQIGTTSPITNFAFSSISGGNFTNDSRYYQTKVIGSFNAAGKLIEWNKTDDPAKQQYIWGHNNLWPIAHITNAESNEIAYTGFEDQPSVCLTPLGNWQFQGACGGWNNTAGNYFTGRTGFNLSPSRTMSCSVPAGTYIVSGWHKDGSFKVNGVTVSTSTGGVWKYAETVLTFTGSSTVAISSGTSDWSQYIDELRLFPADALMKTLSYDDNTTLMLSTADENNVTAHFEYDNLQRLQVIRDQDRNIIQTIEYNFQAAGTGINDIKTRTALISGQTTITQINALTGGSVRKVFQYLDGLGRPIQTSEIAQSPAANDIITLMQYDAYGRAPKKFLPYTNTTNNGAYRTAAATEQSTFTNSFGAGGYGYQETRFEPSPMNRPLEQAAPGATWRIGQGRTTEMLYRGNTSGDAVRDFANNTTFAANLLWVTEETDENERKKWTFTDKLGRVVLVKQELNATETAQTYTIYDDFGRVSYVIPPQTTKKMNDSGIWDPANASYASMIFKYTYDSRGRMTQKTVPSGGTTTNYYDRLDRLVMTVDANGFKLFTRYDILSRPVVTGKYKGVAIPNSGNPLFETPNTTAPHYYTSTTFPTDNNLDVYKVLYYDDYDLDNNGSLGSGETYTNPSESGYETAAFLRTRGKPTATKVGILLNNGNAPTTFLATRTYYDKEYSVIQTNKQNHLGGADITSNVYDFANRVTKTRRDHTATPPGGTLKTYYIREEYTYDVASRLRFTRHHAKTTPGAPTTGWKVTAAPLYDELNRLADKRLHASNYDGASNITLNSSFSYLQSLDYTYNIRGWLTGLNDPGSCAAQSGDNSMADLFSMSLDYESNANGATPQYNGNIAGMTWRTNIGGSCGTRQQYRFTYDYNNRLTAAAHYTHNGSAWTFTNNYSESNITYDLNGNLKTYTRRGMDGGSPANIDVLTYTYGDAARPDRLTNMADATNNAKGFKPTAGAAAYQYDANGNMTQDNHKQFTFAYNHLNLPATMTKGTNVITMTYTAGGDKLAKAVTGGATKNYISGIEYSGANLEAIYFSEGRCTPDGTSAFFYEYTIKDHLGNARVHFRAGAGATLSHLENMHYYPFGMLMEGLGTGTNSPANDYAYNGKELNEDFGLNWSDYGARWYDAALGRWWSVDPLGEKYQGWSGYNYGVDNPVRFVDPDGRSVTTDYYSQKGKYLGNDGNNDGKVVVVTDKAEAKQISKTNKAGGTTESSTVKSGVELPSAFVRSEMKKAVDRAGSPSNHEEGGFFGIGDDGSEVVVHAKPGEQSDPSVDKYASINVFKTANTEDLDKVSIITGAFHTHPDGKVVTGNTDFNTIGGSIKTDTWTNEPSSEDISNAKLNVMGVKGNSYVLAQGNKTVYIYNGGGVVASFPFKGFFTINIPK